MSAWPQPLWADVGSDRYDVESGGGSVAGPSTAVSASSITFRDVRPSDIPELTKLQQALFPVQCARTAAAAL